MRDTIRHAASAFTAGATIAVVFDAVLHVLIQAIRVTGAASAPWWTRTVELSAWMALGLLLWLAAPMVGDWIDEFVPRADIPTRTIWELVGLGMITLPPGHAIGVAIVLAVQFAISGAWASEGQILLSSAYYGAVLLSITPWVAAGAIVRAWAHHMIDE